MKNTNKKTFDILFVLDDKDEISLAAREAEAALIAVKSSLKIGRRSIHHYSNKVITRRILFFLTGQDHDIESRIYRWINNIEYAFVIENPYTVVFLPGGIDDEDFVAASEHNKKVITTVSLDDLSSWWPRVVQELFEFEGFMNEPPFCRIHNVSPEYKQAAVVRDRINNLLQGLGLKTSPNDDVACSHGVAIMRYGTRNEPKTKQVISGLKQSTDKLYVLGTNKRMPDNIVTTMDFYSTSDLLKVSLLILNSVGAIDVDTLTKRDGPCAKYLGIHMQVVRKKHPKLYNLRETRPGREPRQNVIKQCCSGGTNRPPCVVSVSAACVVLTAVVTFLATCAIIGGMYLLTVKHTKDVQRLKDIIKEHDRIMDHLEVEALRKFRAANETFYERMTNLRNETEEQFKVTNETIYSNIEAFRNETPPLYEEMNNTIFPTADLYRNDTEALLNSIFKLPAGFEVYSPTYNAQAIGAGISFSNYRTDVDDILYKSVYYTNTTHSYYAYIYFQAQVNGTHLLLANLCTAAYRVARIGLRASNYEKKFTFYSYGGSSCYTIYVVAGINEKIATNYVVNRGSTLTYVDRSSNSLSGFMINNRP